MELKEKALKLIKNSEPVIIPTDTVYGLLCRYDSKSAVEKIYRLKGRDRNKPLILLGYDWKYLKKFVVVKKSQIQKIKKYLSKWPGALTLILPAGKKVPDFLNKEYKTIGVRVPNNSFLLSILKNCPGKVLASTSANLSGKSPRFPQKALLKKIKLFIKAKKGEMSLKPSKIIEITEKRTKLLR